MTIIIDTVYWQKIWNTRSCSNVFLHIHTLSVWDCCWSRYAPLNWAVQFTVRAHHSVNQMAKPKEVTLGQNSQLLCVSVYFSVLVFVSICMCVCVCAYVGACMCVCMRMCGWGHAVHARNISGYFFHIVFSYSTEEIYGCLFPSNQVIFDERISALVPLAGFALSFKHNLSSLPELHNCTGYQQSEYVYHEHVCITRMALSRAHTSEKAQQPSYLNPSTNCRDSVWKQFY